MRRLAIIGTSLIALALTSCSDDEKAVESPTTPSALETPAVPTSLQDAAKQIQQDEDAASEAYVATELLNVRSGPGVSHQVIGEIQFGSKVVVIFKKGPWTKIGDGRFVYGQYLSNSKPASPIQNPIVVSGAN